MLAVSGTPMAFLGFKYTPIIFTILALAELVTDQLPQTSSRKVPMQFITRILTGSLSGATVGAASGSLLIDLVAGALGAVVRTYGGADLRARLATAFGRDLPAALIEDVVTIALAVVIVTSA
ncbi:MAG: hypothetical protein QOH85_17 [Acidobacteriaceae bacterium]|jgi:uncharacterized membrane protein|nr:hypothetical protein [Acidobacteriaceae bacterium]